MFGKSKDNAANENLDSSPMPEVKHSADAHPATAVTPEATSSISAGLSIIGKIVGQGKLSILGHVEGEVQASSVQIGNGAHVEGNIVAEELVIGGRVKGTIHANRVRLNSTAVVEGDINHRSLAIEENAQFEGMSRRQDTVIDTPSLVPAKRSQAQPMAIDLNGQGNGLDTSQAVPLDRSRRSKLASDLSNP
ncbi:MAG: polymer-forming cytoskeletal protein [Pseudolabrys sp.]|jgi:cytoskeletal protein CcmA (bactofilin family)|nr:polymer-forming cytoskeletal protein [Pseudolabrys sp.]HVR59740.1 polymer-forming cytoskeletal protein [Pseudolabrys sp.]